MTTQNCAECGTRAEPGQSFCDACGSVLGWNPAGARTGPPPAAATATGSGSGSGTATGTRTGSFNSATGSAPGDAAEARWDGFARPGGGTPAPLPGASHLPHQPRYSDEGPAPMGPPPTGGHATGGNPTGGHATGGYPTGGHATGGYPTGGHATGGYPTGGHATGGYPTGGYPDEAAGAAPRATGGFPETDDTLPNGLLHTAGSPGSRSDTMSERARSLLIPVAESAATHPAPPAVAPVLPGRPDADRPQVRTPGPQWSTGNGPPCSWCATPNRPDRHFCTRCAMPLADDDDEQIPGHRSWWRRLTGPRDGAAPWAGDRPRLRRAFDRVGTWITAAIVLTLLVLTGMYLPDGIQASRDHFAKRAPVAPDAIRASRSYTGHKPQLAFDKLNNSWWGPGVSQSGEGEWIEVSFDRPTRLLDVIVTPGVSSKPDQLGKNALPHRVKATITTGDGKTATRELTLDQGAGGQRRTFRVGDATKVRFTVESAHGASATKQVAIAEIEFFGPSNADRS